MQDGKGDSGSRLPTMFHAESVTFLQDPKALLFGSGIARGIVNIISNTWAEQFTSLKIKNGFVPNDTDTDNFKRNNVGFLLIVWVPQ